MADQISEENPQVEPAEDEFITEETEASLEREKPPSFSIPDEPSAVADTGENAVQSFDSALPESAEPASQTSGETPAVSEGTATPTPPVLPGRVQPGLVTRAQVVWIALLSSLLTLCLASILNLVLLASINGGLRYARTAQLGVAQARLDGLSEQAESMRAELDELGTRLEAMQGLDKRITSVEQKMDQSRLEIDDAVAKVNKFQEQLERLSLQVDALTTRVGRFQTFLDGLTDLLTDLMEPIP